MRREVAVPRYKNYLRNSLKQLNPLYTSVVVFLRNFVRNYETREGTCEFYFLTCSDDLICCSNDLISCLHNLSSCSNNINKLL